MPSANHSADTSRDLWGSWYSMNTTPLDSRLRGNDGRQCGSDGGIPAYAGMTGDGAGMTGDGAGMMGAGGMTGVRTGTT